MARLLAFQSCASAAAVRFMDRVFGPKYLGPRAVLVSAAWSLASLHLCAVGPGLAAFDSVGHFYYGAATDPRRAASWLSFAAREYAQYAFIVASEPVWFLVFVVVACLCCSTATIAAARRVAARMALGLGPTGCLAWAVACVLAVVGVSMVVAWAIWLRPPLTVMGYHDYMYASALFWFWSVVTSVSLVPGLLAGFVSVALVLKLAARPYRWLAERLP